MDSDLAIAIHFFLKNNYYFVKKLLKKFGGLDFLLYLCNKKRK